MPRTVLRPPTSQPRAGGVVGGWWHEEAEGGRIACDLCPRDCKLKPGDRGFCFVRQNVGGEMVLTTYGKSTGFCIDPIEKKPLNHFYPGTSVLSFGTAGCNLGCKFCQNWDISKSREVERLSDLATPEAIAEAARRHGCTSVAFTYNDPVIWAEYAIDTARACRERGIRAVAVTAGYIRPEAREPFFGAMDAANVDLKGFTEEFYYKITYSHLQPVLDTLAWLKSETDVWFEITNLVIPGANDDPGEIRRMCGWVLEHCGDEVPVHFSAFHPDFRMRDRPNTPPETLLAAHEQARAAGLKYVYVGNVHDAKHGSTFCPACGGLLIERDWYELGRYHLRGDRCGHCGAAVAGRFGEQPGTWGRRRQPVEIATPRRGPGPPQVIEVIQPGPAMSAARQAEAKGQAAPRGVELDDQQRASILKAAGAVVAAAVRGRPLTLDDPGLAGAADLPVLGAYVTLKRKGHLRACCGLLGEPRRLVDALLAAARRTALEDHRLPPIAAEELAYLDLDVNLLHSFERLEVRGADRVAAVEVGRHGLRIHRGEAGGLLLPGVATEHGWDAEAFLRGVCRKASLPTTAWQEDDTHLFTFESSAFGGPFDHGGDADAHAAAPPVDEAGLLALARHAGANVEALALGLTPSYYMTGASDGTVTGLVLSLVPGTGPGASTHLAQVVFRPGLPLQSGLFTLCEHAARAIRQGVAGTGPVRLGLSVLSHPALHGAVADPDLRGFDPARRALLLIEQGRSSCVYNPSATAEAVFEAAKRGLPLLNKAACGVYSVAVRSTEPSFAFGTAPRAAADVSPNRPPAVAGAFYPGDAAALSRTVDALLAQSERRPESWPAVMVPHAGLKYSGRLAAATFNRVEFPSLAIVIGPKHTRDGVPWAVAPQASWSIPGATIPSDPELARRLAEAVHGLQLDAAAHAREHAIEVELPFLARLAPDAKVLGIALGAGDWEHCERFAEGLAAFLKGLPEPPLLVISSDMNHFATDAENRRLDAIALDAMARLDPAALLATVREHDISMCGVIPAVVVMETLRRLGGLTACERVGYATSAEVSGDPSRVVGYAGMLLR